MLQRCLIFCGILSSLLFIGMNIVIPLQWAEYSSASQTVSELSALGAPTRSQWLFPGFIYTLLITAFGWGAIMSARQNRSLSIMGILIVAYGVIGLLWPFAPMHLRGEGFTLTDIMHISLAMVSFLLMLLAVGFGSAAFGKRFLYYSITTLVVLFISGFMTGLDGPRIMANLPTPWVGVWERISIGVFLLWIIVLAIVLLRDSNVQPRKQS